MGHGRPGFPQGFSCPVVLRNGFKSLKFFVYRTLTVFGRLFQNLSTKLQVCHSLSALRSEQIPSCNPTAATPVSLHSNGLDMFPVRSPLLRESLICFLFLGVLRWFTSPGLLPVPMNSVQDRRPLRRRGCPIRKSTGQSLLAAHRSVSPPAASFIASGCQGIHRMLLVA